MEIINVDMMPETEIGVNSPPTVCPGPGGNPCMRLIICHVVQCQFLWL